MHNYLRSAMAAESFQGTPFSWPGTLYFGLVTTAPSASTPGTEVTAGGYARASLTSTSGHWSNTTGVSQNQAILSFGTASADWDTVVAVEVYDAAGAGANALCWATLSPSRTITAGTTVTVPVADLTFTWS
jgi:hypothetical protein